MLARLKDLRSRMTAKEVLVVFFFFLMGCGAGTYLHWPALTTEAVYKSDTRQVPHWNAYHNDEFQDHDPIVEYASFNESPLQNAIYWVATLFGDLLSVTKVLAVLSMGLLAAWFYVIGRLWHGMRFGALSALFVTFFPDQFDYSAGFFSKFWMIPLVLTAAFLLAKEYWRGLVALIPFAALAYPVTAVVVGLISAIHMVMLFFEDRAKARLLFKWLCSGSAIGIAFLMVKYISPPDFIGPMRDGAELMAMPEMLKGGMLRSPYVPIPSLYHELTDRLDHPFLLFSSILYFVALRRGFGWEKSWTAVFLAGVVGYIVASAVFMQLYIPNRYTRYSLGVLVVLWHARNWDLILEKVPSKPMQVLLVSGLIAVGGYAYKDTFEMGKDAYDRSRYDDITGFCATLPDKSLIAGPPKLLDNISLQAKASILTTYKIAHPWFVDYYAMIEERTNDDLAALFAGDAATVNLLHSKYGATHIVVQRNWYVGEQTAKKVYVEPYRSQWKTRLAENKRHFYLKQPPRESVLYEDRHYFVLQLPLPTEGPQ